jgi:hypothetical protein
MLFHPLDTSFYLFGAQSTLNQLSQIELEWLIHCWVIWLHKISTHQYGLLWAQCRSSWPMEKRRAAAQRLAKESSGSAAVGAVRGSTATGREQRLAEERREESGGWRSPTAAGAEEEGGCG